MGFICLGIYVMIFIIYLFWDGWAHEWYFYGYDGASQHFDINIFSDMVWSLNSKGERVIESTNNLHNLVYICYYTGLASVIGLITGNEWFKKGSILISGEKAKMDDEIEFPITGLVFFPNGKRKTTLW